jgi:hypothetical protein
LIATPVSPLIHKVIVGLDGHVPLPIKKLSATTEKNQRCRVKLKLENRVIDYWRQQSDEWGGELLDDWTWRTPR